MNQELMGKFISQERKNKKLTQEQLAEKLKVDRTVVSRWERGVSAPDISLLKDLAQVLNVSVVEILNAKKDEVNSNNDDAMIGAIKFYKNKIMKKMIICLVVVVIILTIVFVTSSVVSKRNYFAVKEINYSGDFITSGYYFANEFGKSILFIRSLNYNGGDVGTIDEPLTGQVDVTLTGKGVFLIKNSLYCDFENCSLSSLLEEYDIVENFYDDKYDLDDFYLSIHFVDSNLKEHYYSIPLSNKK